MLIMVGLKIYIIKQDKSKVKGSLSDLELFLATENPLKMIKNAFNFTLKALLAIKIFKFLS